jgi:hypothetical protein
MEQGGTQVMEMATCDDDQVLQLGKEERGKQNPMEIKAKV